jgi:hypothetical protein
MMYLNTKYRGFVVRLPEKPDSNLDLDYTPCRNILVISRVFPYKFCDKTVVIHARFLSNPLWFIIQMHPTFRRFTTYATEK